MKNKFLSVIALAIIAGVFGFRTLSTKGESKVNMVNGLYIFTDGTPKNKYEILGVVKSPVFTSSSQYTDIRDALIDNAREQYPQADGIILEFRTGKRDLAQAIKIED